MISKSLNDINIIIICSVINIIMATKCVVNAPSPICFPRFHWLGPGWGGGKVSPRKYVAQSACQYDVTSRVSNFQNGKQRVHRRNG